MFYNFLKIIIKFILFFLVKIEVNNKDNVPLEGPLVIVSNHTSFWDPIILGVSLPRKLHFMAKEELFKVFLLGYIIRKLGTFPVKRGRSDRNAIREALRVLKNEKVLCIFPEGTRSKNGELLDFQPGVTLISYKGSAPVLPIGIIGVKDIFKGIRPKIKINIGKPVYINEMIIKGNAKSEQIDEVTKLLHNKVKTLLK